MKNVVFEIWEIDPKARIAKRSIMSYVQKLKILFVSCSSIVAAG